VADSGGRRIHRMSRSSACGAWRSWRVATRWTRCARRGGQRTSRLGDGPTKIHGPIRLDKVAPHVQHRLSPRRAARKACARLVVGSPCPICRRVALRGRQTVCSAACRRRRSREREASKRARRDQKIRALLGAALRKTGGGFAAVTHPIPRRETTRHNGGFHESMGSFSLRCWLDSSYC
jgi:hypothetical protein